MKKCKHRYQPRYNKTWTTIVEESIKLGYDIKKATNIEPYLKSETYIHDICVRCGDIKK